MINNISLLPEEERKKEELAKQEAAKSKAGPKFKLHVPEKDGPGFEDSRNSKIDKESGSQEKQSSNGIEIEEQFEEESKGKFKIHTKEKEKKSWWEKIWNAD